jgi:hypothetical protein
MRKAYHSGLMANQSGIDEGLGRRKTLRVRREQKDPRREYAFAKQESLGRGLE